MRKSILFVVLLFTAGCVFFSTVFKELPHSVLLMTSEVVQNMQEIQKNYEIETVRCLTGYTQWDTVFVMSIEPTWMNAQDDVSASFRACEQEDVVGYYHNHPGTYEDGVYASFCGFSPVDYRTFRGLQLEVAILSCNERTLVWMFRDNPRPISWTGVPTPPE